jgi:ABC-2 type transport system permease protein
MRGILAITKRELFSFFVTPLAWVLIVVFLLVQGLHFTLLVDFYASQLEVVSDRSPLSSFFGDTVLLYIVLFLLIPPLTMRLISEERRSGTLESLFTTPVSTLSITLGKYFAALLTYVAMWIPTGYYLVILSRTGRMDFSVAWSSYLGVGLIGASLIAVGLLMSSLTRSQFLALVYTALFILCLFIGGIAEFATREGTLANTAASYVSVWAQMNEFSSGIIDSRRIVWNGSLILYALFLTHRNLDTLRGRTS